MRCVTDDCRQVCDSGECTMKCRTTNDCEQSCLPFFSACPLLDCHSKQKSCRQVSEAQEEARFVAVHVGQLNRVQIRVDIPHTSGTCFCAFSRLLFLTADLVPKNTMKFLTNWEGALGHIILLQGRRESSEERESRILIPLARPWAKNSTSYQR